MRLIVYDCEVYAYDWLVVLKDKENGDFTVIHNDNDALRAEITDDAVYIGFNSKSYDQYIIKAICTGASVEEVKQVNDYIIGGGQGWECPLLNGSYFRFNNVDIRDDVQKGLSLKAIEGHLGMSVEETEIDFNLGRPLTQDELNSIIHYCKHDVDATEKLCEVRKDYLQTKLNLGARANIQPEKALAMTNAKLTAAMLQAQRREWSDGREYVYPPNLDISVIPKDILDFFDTIHDMSIPDDELFKTYFNTKIGGMPCKYAWGGVHGSLLCYHEEATETRAIQNRDVSSLYPSLIERYNYLSRNVPDPQLFYSIRKERIEAKHRGDKQTAKDLKLPLNTVSGAQENQYNDLYDPLPTRSLRISGQLFLTVLAVKLLDGCETIKLLNFNTDGLMYSIDRVEIPIADAICAEWEKTTGFELELDDIAKVWIKDVNNLLEIQTNGDVKTVGGYLNYGVSVKGAWAINNNAIIVKKAIVDYFVKGIPVETTIGECNDIFSFQWIAKAGAKYKEAYHLVDDVRQSVQRVNRVYATSDTRYGKLFKVKAETDASAKIEMLPDHCIIDNDNHLTITDVDKTFYIEMAKKRINDYLGIKPEKKGRTKKMATTKVEKPTTMNVYQKLLTARQRFLEAGISKSGKHMKMTYKYFELDDIIPASTPIFAELGLLPLVSFGNDTATMTMVNTDAPEETIVFTSPMRDLDEYNHETGNRAVNPMQALGACETYQRRYLYMAALDICETDSIDSGSLATPESEPRKAPASPETREEVKNQLTNAEGNASELQIKQLKNALKLLKTKDPSKEEMIATIAIQTQSFTVITKSDCEKILTKVSELLGGEENNA